MATRVCTWKLYTWLYWEVCHFPDVLTHRLRTVTILPFSSNLRGYTQVSVAIRYDSSTTLVHIISDYLRIIVVDFEYTYDWPRMMRYWSDFITYSYDFIEYNLGILK